MKFAIKPYCMKPATKQYLWPLWPSEVPDSKSKPALIQRKPDGTIFALDIAHISNRAIHKIIAVGTDMKEVYAKVERYYDKQFDSIMEYFMLQMESQIGRPGAQVRNFTLEFSEHMREAHGTATAYGIATEILDEEMRLNGVV